MGLKAELAYEQAFVDSVYDRISTLRDESAALASEVVGEGKGGLVANRIDRDARVALSLRRASSLSVGDTSVCFGRLDMDEGDRWHLGRLGISDADGEVLLMDWRAPMAEAFYRVTSQNRRGVALRRYIRMRSRVVTGIDDEPLAGPQRSDQSHLVGEGALLAALSSPRTGRMGDIVATIQADQDTAIRAAMGGPLVIEGGPGTGKTAVALHRAAYLLYEHRFPLASQGVLVVGPNPTFCHYIEQVLPGLGETGVRLANPADLVAEWRADAVDKPEVAAIKASGEMVDRLATTLRSFQRPLEVTEYIGAGIHRLAVTPAGSENMIDKARQAGPHNQGRPVMRRLLLRYLLRRADQVGQRAVRTGLVATRGALPPTEAILDTLRRSEQVNQLTERLWPTLTPEDLVDAALAALGVPRESQDFSEHDLALLDEAKALLGEPKRRKRPARTADVPGGDEALDATLSGMGMIPSCPRCSREVTLSHRKWNCESCQRSWPLSKLVPPEQAQQVREIIERIQDTHRQPSEERVRETFGHVIVDEAQDLSPMQWRVLARRCPTGSFTIVGDLGQAVPPWSPNEWAEICAIAAPGHPSRVDKLTVNYRTPAEVMGLAAAVLAEHRPHLVPPTAVRSSGVEPETIALPIGEDLAQAVQLVAKEEAACVSPGNVGVIRAGGTGRHPRRPPASPLALDQPIVELTIAEAKGLEFDSVIIVEPADFSRGELYVAMTRTTSRLTLVHQRPLPEVVSNSLADR